MDWPKYRKLKRFDGRADLIIFVRVLSVLL